MMLRVIVTAGLLAAGLALPSGPAAAQSGREFCVANLPYPPVPPATASRLVVNQAYIVPVVGASSTEFRVHAQLQNQSSGTIQVRVQTANLTPPPGGRWIVDRERITLTSYQPVDVVFAKFTLPTQTNTSPVDAWDVVTALLRSCPFERGS